LAQTSESGALDGALEALAGADAAVVAVGSAAVAVAAADGAVVAAVVGALVAACDGACVAPPPPALHAAANTTVPMTANRVSFKSDFLLTAETGCMDGSLASHTL
jgi:hypothetical protein